MSPDWAQQRFQDWEVTDRVAAAGGTRRPLGGDLSPQVREQQRRGYAALMESVYAPSRAWFRGDRVEL